MTEENTKKNNFFKEMLKSITGLEKYEDFALEKPKKAFGYFIKLVLIFSLILTAFYTYKIVNNAKNIYDNIILNLPEFSYSNGILQFNQEEPIIINEYEDSIGQIIIDTKTEDKLIDYEESDINGIVLLKDKVVIKGGDVENNLSYNYTEFTNNYNISEFNKDGIINYVNELNIVSVYATIYLILYIYIFIIYFISILIDVLLLSLLVLIISRLTRIKLKYAPSFNIAIHGITLPVVLNLIYIIVNLLTGFEIKNFQLMYNIVSYIYVIVAVFMIKTDFINRQLELIKMEKEKKEIKNKEVPEKESEDKEENKKENKKEEDKEEVEKDGETNPSSACEENE